MKMRIVAIALSFLIIEPTAGLLAQEAASSQAPVRVGDFYRLPNDQIPLRNLFRVFFVHVDSRMGGDPVTDGYWGDFLERLGIKSGTPAEAALLRAVLDYRLSLPTEAEKRAEADAMEALLGDEVGFMARSYQNTRAKTLRLAEIVRTLDEELRQAGASLDGIRAYLEAEIRPTMTVMSDKPRGADESYFEHGDAFCREARIDCPNMEAN